MARRPAVSTQASQPPQRSRLSTRESIQAFQKTSPGDLFWDLLTFDRLLTGPVVHIIYWAGLALIAIAGFGIVGGSVGMALREEGVMGWLLAFAVLVFMLVGLAAAALIWRSVCEFYVAVFRISDDLRAMRANLERGLGVVGGAVQPGPKAVDSEPRREAGNGA
jgi:hypothetical protein